MYPAALYPGAAFPGPTFPGAGKGIVASSSGVLYPGSVFPASVFPASVFPGSSPAPQTIPDPFEVTLSAFLVAQLPGIGAWHGAIPQRATLPAIAWLVVDADSGTNLAGPSGLAWDHVQFTVYSGNPSDCWAWGEALRKALVGPAGKAAFPTCNARGKRTGFDPGPENASRGTHSFMREFYIWHGEPRS